MEHYVLIQWPDSQQVIETAIKEGWEDECSLAADMDSAYFVPVRRIEGMQKITRENILSHLLTYQLNIIGKRRTDILDVENFRFNWTITRKQYTEFRGYAIPLIKKVFKCNKSRAQENFEWFYQTLGLRIKD